MTDELKPCLFCGSRKVVAVRRLGLSSVTCDNCGAYGPFEDTEADAIAVWNLRAMDEPTDAMIAAGAPGAGPRCSPRGTGAAAMQNKPTPGSSEAIALGCRCPVLDNSHGAGDGRGNFWVSELCPVHAVKENGE